MKLLNGLFRLLFITLCIAFSLNAKEKKCLIVASYHDGFKGQALKVNAAKNELKRHCIIKQFNMDSKRNPDSSFIEKKALEAKELIESWQPDVVLAIEDNASKYLVMKYFKNRQQPIVFSGVDWSAKKYGYPYKNVTGMIEIAPFQEAIKQIKMNIPNVKKGVIIRPNRYSAMLNYNRAKEVYTKAGIELEDGVVNNYEEFKEVFLKAQNNDFIHFTNNDSIQHWNDKDAIDFIEKNNKKLIISTVKWMIPFSILGLNQVIEEQGEYAAQIAIEILNGASPSDFPIVANRKWSIAINQNLLEKSGIKLTPILMQKARKY